MKWMIMLAVLVAGTISFAKKNNAENVADRFDLVDTNSDKKISLKEWLKKHQERFQKIDTNGDGFITKEERNKFEEELIIIRRETRSN